MLVPLALASLSFATASDKYDEDSRATADEERWRRFSLLRGMGDSMGAWQSLLAGLSTEQIQAVSASLAERARTSLNLDELREALDEADAFSSSFAITNDLTWKVHRHFIVPFRPGEVRPWSRLPEQPSMGNDLHEIGIPWFDSGPSFRIEPFERGMVNQTVPKVTRWLRPMDPVGFQQTVSVSGAFHSNTVRGPTDPTPGELVPHSFWSRDAERALVSTYIDHRWGSPDRSKFWIVPLDEVAAMSNP